MVEDRERKGVHGSDLNCSMGLGIRTPETGKGWLLLDGSRGSVGRFEEGFRIYQRRKRRKISNSDEITNSGFSVKTESGGGSAFDQYVRRSSLGAFPNGPGESSHRNIALQHTHQLVNGHRGRVQNALVTYSENYHTPVTKESVGNIERTELSNVFSNGLVKGPEASTNSELCGHALSDILNSNHFNELSGLLLNNFGVVSVKQVLDIDTISLKLKNGAYETSPMLYLNDIQHVWSKLEQVGNEMVTLANCLSDKSMTHYEQFVRKHTKIEASGCQGCGDKADVENCLVCDSCEDVYHLQCTELVGTLIPPKSWYCAACVSNGIGSPHDGCTACEKLKSADSVPVNNGPSANHQSQDLQVSVTDEHQVSKICFVCKSEAKIGDDLRTCGHSLCPHKFYHNKCLTRKQLAVCGPCWYCPSCLCRRCLVDTDDDRIVLCDGCDHAYHIYCTTPQLDSVPEGKWFCGKCDRDLKRIRAMKMAYESVQKKVKVEDGSEQTERQEPEEREGHEEREGLEMLVTAAKTISNEETLWNAI